MYGGIVAPGGTLYLKDFGHSPADYSDQDECKLSIKFIMARKGARLDKLSRPITGGISHHWIR